MAIYALVSTYLIISGLFFEFINTILKQSRGKKLPIVFYAVPSFLVLFFVSGFRGDFTADYKEYTYLFDLYNSFKFSDVFEANLYQEIGYIALSRFIGFFTHNELYLFIITSFIILCAFYKQFKNDSAYMWLSVLLFVTVGSFYTSFNIIRQILAAAIVFSGSRFLYERKMLKYFLVIVLASLFHRTALIMLLFYFILNFKINYKNMFIVSLGVLVISINLPMIVTIAQQIFYTAYTADAYGMTGLSFTNAVAPVSIFLFSFIHRKKLDNNNIKQRVWMNAAFYYALFNVLGTQIQMIQRLSEFFAPYILLLIPLIFYRMRNNELKAIYIMGFVTVLFLYNLMTLSGTGYDPYYFVWQGFVS